MKKVYNVRIGFNDTIIHVGPRNVRPGSKFLWRGELYTMKRIVPQGVEAVDEGGGAWFVGHNAKVECYFSELEWL